MKRLDAGALSKAERDDALAAGHVRVNGQQIRVDGTVQRLGGRRAWWRCPKCDGRCRYLYTAGEALACRECRGLTYPSRALKGTAGALAYRALQAVLLARRKSRAWRSDRRRRASIARWDRATRCMGVALVELLDREKRTIHHTLEATAQRYEATGNPGSFDGTWRSARHAVNRKAPDVDTTGLRWRCGLGLGSALRRTARQTSTFRSALDGSTIYNKGAHRT